jgi:two-component system NtrC family sensor kinase
MRARSDAAVRMLKTMLVASVAIPVAIFSYASWTTYHDAYTHADERLWASLGIMSEHTSRIVQSVDLTFAAVDAIAGNLTDEQIKAAEPALHALLDKL